MISTAWAIVGTLLVGTFAGWAAHLALHVMKIKLFTRYHAAHHKLYPSTKFRSKKYVGPAFDPASLFITATVTVALFIFMATFIVVNASMTAYIAVVLIGLSVGWVHDYVHKAFHTEDHWLDRFKSFRSIRDLHCVHHGDARVNYGIVTYAWDKLFKRFKLSR